MHFVEQKQALIKMKRNFHNKMGNSTYIFKDMNLVLHLIKLQIKSKTVMSWSLRKKKGGIFFYRLFCPEGFFLIFVFYLNV